MGLRQAIEIRTGPVTSAIAVNEGDNSALAAVLETKTGETFVKGIRCDHPGAVAQAREVAVAPYVEDVSPRLLWRLETDGWDVLAFEYIRGRLADYATGSRDLEAVSQLMSKVSQLYCPDLAELKRAEMRWRDFLDGPGDADELAGVVLLHTDWNPANVLITDRGARLVDWAWPTLGAGWLDPACWILRLIAAGHDPEGAENCARTVPAWHTATCKQLDRFATANARLWNGIAAADRRPFKVSMSTAAREWADHRMKTPGE